MPSSIMRATFVPSAIVLLLANLIPVLGVLFWDWSAFVVLLLFWMENVVIGGFNLLRILTSQGEGYSGPAALATKLFTAVFFCLHYGIFTTVHGIFILVLFGGTPDDGPAGDEFGSIWHAIIENQLQWAIIPLVLSHGFSFFDNYIGKGEYRTTKLYQAMNAPYNRIIVLHVTILAGGFLVMSLGSPTMGVVLLVVFKTLMDLRSHLKEHRRAVASPKAATQVR